ncbi:MAG: MBL fold metallo-hydrolase [Candidatus Parvarchaeota archaeon]|nr:MBL fold metallo-hydrolase [Candidatus Parvarchaeota archaeon]
MLKFTFLGTSSAVPTKTRNHPSIYLEFDGNRVLLDCGEGTQRQIRKAGLSPSVSDIFLTHWHGDHSLGVGGMIHNLNMIGQDSIRLYGPAGTNSSVKSLISAYRFDMRIKVFTKSLDAKKETKIATIGNYDFFAINVKHTVKCLSYKIKEKDSINIDSDKLKKYGIKPGPALKKLKEGKDAVIDGIKIRAKDVTYIKKGRTLVYMTDLVYEDRLLKFVKGADVLIIESTLHSDLQSKAGKFMHLTVNDAVKIGKKAEVKKIFLVHTSQRYEGQTSIEDDMKKQVAALRYKGEAALPNDLDGFLL